MSSTYTSLEAELHDPFWSDEDTPEFDWLDALLSEHPGPALEVGSGSGRLLLPLLDRGHDIEGLEPSEAMLALCRKSAEGREPGPVLHQGDMATFSPGKTYHSLLVPAFTLQLAEDPAAVLANFHRLIKPNGLLYLTVFIPFAELGKELPENEWYPDHETTLPDGRHASVETRHTLNRKKRILQREHHYRIRDGDKELEHFSKQTVRWFSPHQLRKLLEDAGFIPDRAVADFDESEPITDESQILTIVAHRSDDSAI